MEKPVAGPGLHALAGETRRLVPEAHVQRMKKTLAYICHGLEGTFEATATQESPNREGWISLDEAKRQLNGKP